MLPVVRATDLARQDPERRWLIRDLWGHQAQGIIGGAPKLGKSFFGLDLAVSVASATDCLGAFEVLEPGRTLVYLAEDVEASVRDRIEALCQHRGLDLETLDLHVITAPVLRLDQGRDRQRLEQTLEALRPRLLLLDPLVRLHRLDENSAQEISGLLGYLTELGRRFEVAIVLVHHASKKHRARPGQSLRGSSDLHAWGASNAYLSQGKDGVVLTLEHRAAPSPKPLRLALVSRADGSATHFELDGVARSKSEASLTHRVLEALVDGPTNRQDLRQRLRVNNQKLGNVLVRLEAAGSIQRSSSGWRLPST